MACDTKISKELQNQPRTPINQTLVNTEKYLNKIAKNRQDSFKIQQIGSVDNK